MEDENTTKLVAQFLQWEQASRDTIDFKKSYVDMAGDLIAGLVLSQIVYWHLPGQNGITRLRVSRDNELWIAKARKDWYEEVRVSPKQLDRALAILEKRELIVTKVYHFGGFPTKHIRLVWVNFLDRFKVSILPKGEISKTAKLPKGKKPNSPKVNLDIDQKGIYYNTESTTKNTTESLTPPASQPSIPPISVTPKTPKKSAITSKSKTERGKSSRALPRYDPLWNALADTFFQGARKGNQRLARILFGKADHGLFGLIAFEMEHQRCTEDKLDYVAIASWVAKFHASLPKDNSGKTIELRDPAKFVERWIGWRETQNRISCPPQLTYDPNCPHRFDQHPCEEGTIYRTDEKGMPYRDECECRTKIMALRKGDKI